MANPRWLRDARRAMARMPSFSMGRVPDAPTMPIRDPWPGDPTLGAKLIRAEMEFHGVTLLLRPGHWGESTAAASVRAYAHGFSWLRDLRSLGTDAARTRGRALVADWMATPSLDSLAQQPDVIGTRLASWLGHYDFFAASADDAFRQRLMTRLVSDARALAATLPAEELDARALTSLKGLIAAAVALPDQAAFLTRALRFLPQEIARQILPDGCHAERSTAAHMSALQDLVEIRALLQAAQAQPPAALANAIERMGPALRMLRHGDGGLALYNGSKEQSAALIDLVLAQAGRTGRSPSSLNEGGFQRLQAGRTVILMDCGRPPPRGVDRLSQAGTLSIEMSVGRERLIVNCGAAPAGGAEWYAATRATAAHSTLVIGDTNSSELRPIGLGRQPEQVKVQRQEANGAHWLESSHDGYRKPFGALHRRRLYVSESGEDVRGEDAVEADNPQPYTLRFHLHPTVNVSLQHDGEAALLRLPSGSGWRLRAEGARITLEESGYLGAAGPKRTEQVVLTGYQDGPQQVKWAISKLG